MSINTWSGARARLKRFVSSFVNAKTAGAVVAIVLAVSFFAPASAFAATTISSVSVNNGSVVTIKPNTNFTVKVTATNSSTSQWHSTGWSLTTSDTNPSSGTCVNAPATDWDSNGASTTAFQIASPASAGTYNLYVRTSGSNSSCNNSTSNWFKLADSVVVDGTAPILAQVAAVPTPGTNTTPSYTFSSTEAGTIQYGGDCSSATTAAVSGNNTIAFNALSVGTHNNCTIKVTDTAGNQSSSLAVASFTITAPADTTVPTVSLTAPANNATVSGSSVALSATASDNVGVAGVTFKLDTNTIIGSEDTSSPYDVTWNTTGVSNGAHTIVAVARDAAGNLATSTAVSVTVNNVVAGPDCSAVVDVAHNLINNPCFEDGTTYDSGAPADTTGPDSWYLSSEGVTGGAIYPAASHNSGTKAAEVHISSLTGSGAHYIQWGSAPAPVEGSKNYTFSFWYNSTVDSEVDIGYHFGANVSYGQLRSNLPSTGGVWKQFSTNVVTPPGTDSVEFSPLITKVGSLTIDDISLVENTTFANTFTAGMVSLNFDDGLASFWDNATSTLNAAGLKATEYIITGSTGSNLPNVSPNGGYLSRSQIQALAAAGYDIGDHTASHPDLTSGVNLTTEINSSVSTLAAVLGTSVKTMAYPYGAYNQTVETQTQNVPLLAARSVDDGFNDKNPNADKYALKIKEIFATTPVSTVEGWIDTANATHTWLILLMHDVQPTCTLTDAQGNPVECITKANLQTIANYLNSSHTQVVTMSKGISVMNGTDVLDNTPPVITLTGANPQTIEIGTAYSELGATASDDVSGNLTSSIVIDSSAVNTNTIGSYTVKYDVTDGAGNHATQATRTVNVVPRTLTITATNATKVFGATDPVLAYTITSGSLLGTDTLTGVPVRDAGEALGSYDIATGTVAVSANPANYNFVFVHGTFTITKVPVTITIGNLAATYDGTAKAATITLDPAVAYTVTYDGSADVPTDAGTYPVVVTVTDPNYEGTKSDTLVVSPVAIAVTAENKTKVFGDTDPALTYTYTGTLVGADAFTGALARTGAEAVGAYEINQGDLALTPNYALTFAPGTFTITGIPSDISISNLNQTYDGTPKAVTVTSDFENSVTYNGNPEVPTDAGSYDVVATITQEGHSGSATGTLVIAPVEIGVKADDIAKAFGADDPALTFSTTTGAFMGTDYYTAATLTRAEGEGIGSYAITGNFTANANYHVTFTPGTFTISADPDNASPVSDSQTLSTYQNEATSSAMTATDPDAADHGNPVLAFTVVDYPAHGTIATTTPTAFTYTPAADYAGSDFFTFKTNDGNSDSNLATVAISVNVKPTCPTGATYDSSANQCVFTSPISACPTGSTLATDGDNAGMCVADPIAPVAPTCPANSTLNPETDMCETAAVPPTAPTCTAPATYDTAADQCVDSTDAENPVTSPATCPEGSTLNTETDMCETPAVAPVAPTCPADTSYDAETNMCVATLPAPVAPSCPADSTPVEGHADECQPNPVAPSCPADFDLLGNACVPKLDVCPNIDGIQESVPSGYQMSGSQCVPIPAPVSSGGGGGGGGGGSIIQSYAKGDANHDGKVNILDFVTLMANWGTVSNGPVLNQADFNADGKVDILDFVLLMANWSK